MISTITWTIILAGLVGLTTWQMSELVKELRAYWKRCEGCGKGFWVEVPSTPVPCLCKACRAQYKADMFQLATNMTEEQQERYEDRMIQGMRNEAIIWEGYEFR